MWLSRACEEGLVDSDVILVVFFCWSGFLFLRDGFESVIKAEEGEKHRKEARECLQSYHGLSESQPRENRNEWGGVIARTLLSSLYLSSARCNRQCWSLNDGWDYFGCCSRLLRERKRNIQHMRQKAHSACSLFLFVDCHVFTLFLSNRRSHDMLTIKKKGHERRSSPLIINFASRETTTRCTVSNQRFVFLSRYVDSVASSV